MRVRRKRKQEKKRRLERVGKNLGSKEIEGEREELEKEKGYE